MLLRVALLGLVLTSLVLAVPTRFEEERSQMEESVSEEKSRRDAIGEETRREEAMTKGERRRSEDEMKREREQARRELDDERKDSKKESRRGSDAEQRKDKKESRRGTDEMKKEREEARRELNDERESKKKESRRGSDAERKDELNESRRDVDAERKDELDESRRDVDAEQRKDSKKESRRGTDDERHSKKESRRGSDAEQRKDKKESRRGTDEMKREREEARRELNDERKDKKKESRRGSDAEQREDELDESRRDVDAERKDNKKESRRGTDEMKKENKEARRELNAKENENNEEKRDSESAAANQQREKRRPTPAIKEESQRDVNSAMSASEFVSSASSSSNNDDELMRSRREISDVEAVRLCDSVTDFKYYQKIDSEPSKYVECDPWGTGKVKSCAEGLLWNEWTLRCDAKEHIHNMTLDLSKFSVSTVARPLVNCTLVGMQCLNGGSCVQAASGSDFKCTCQADYTGQFCESRVDLADISHELLNGTFSVHDYVERLREENLTQSRAYYEKLRGQLDPATYTQLIAYLDLFKEGEVRYDTLVNSLVADILENIYPDAEYLSVFNASEQNVVTLVQIIPSLLSYSRYSFERYQDVFAQYQQVLLTVVKTLNASLPNVVQQASLYTNLTSIFLNRTLSLLNEQQHGSHLLVNENAGVSSPIELNETEIKRVLREQYNETLRASEQLIGILEKFQSAVVREAELSAGSVANLTLGEAAASKKLAGADEILAVLNQVSVASAQIFESLVSYGFWFVTNSFSTAATKVDTLNRFSFNINKV